MNKNLKLFIAISVLLNILLVGVMLGYALRSPWLLGHRPPPPPAPPELSQLPPEKRELFETTMKRTREEGDNLRKEIREIREDMEKILSADVFDEAAYRAESEKIAALYSQQRLKMNEAIIGIAKQSSKEERAILSKITRRPAPPLPPPPHSGPHGDGPPPPPPGEGPMGDNPPAPPPGGPMGDNPPPPPPGEPR